MSESDAPPDAAVPPNDLDAERLILCVALERGTEAIPNLAAKHFYADANRHVFAAVKDLESSGVPIDAIAVSRLLRADRDEYDQTRSRLDSVGGIQAIGELVTCTPTTVSDVNASAYAADVIEMWKRRCLSQALQEANVKIRLGGMTSAECWEWFRGRAKEIADAL